MTEDENPERTYGSLSPEDLIDGFLEEQLVGLPGSEAEQWRQKSHSGKAGELRAALLGRMADTLSCEKCEKNRVAFCPDHFEAFNRAMYGLGPEFAVGEPVECNLHHREDAERLLGEFCDAVGAGGGFPLAKAVEALQLMGIGLPKLDPDHEEVDCGRPGCGHEYSRHFDGYEGDRMVGCKYCSCMDFIEPGAMGDAIMLTFFGREIGVMEGDRLDVDIEGVGKLSVFRAKDGQWWSAEVLGLNSSKGGDATSALQALEEYVEVRFKEHARAVLGVGPVEGEGGYEVLGKMGPEGVYIFAEDTTIAARIRDDGTVQLGKGVLDKLVAERDTAKDKYCGYQDCSNPAYSEVYGRNEAEPPRCQTHWGLGDAYPPKEDDS